MQRECCRRRNRRLGSRLPVRGVEKRPFRVRAVDAGGGLGDPHACPESFGRRVCRSPVANQGRRRATLRGRFICSRSRRSQVGASRAACYGDTQRMQASSCISSTSSILLRSAAASGCRVAQQTAGIEANSSGAMCQGARVRQVGSGNAIVHLRKSRFLNLSSILKSAVVKPVSGFERPYHERSKAVILKTDTWASARKTGGCAWGVPASRARQAYRESIPQSWLPCFRV